MPVKIYMSPSGTGISGLQTYIDKQNKQNLGAKAQGTWAQKLLDKSIEVAKNDDQE